MRLFDLLILRLRNCETADRAKGRIAPTLCSLSDKTVYVRTTARQSEQMIKTHISNQYIKDKELVQEHAKRV